MSDSISRLAAAFLNDTDSASVTRRLLALIGSRAEGMTTTELRLATDMDCKRIRGYLKAPAERGEVLYSARHWTLNPRYVCPHVQKVVQALRDAGWTVTEPWNKKGAA